MTRISKIVNIKIVRPDAVDVVMRKLLDVCVEYHNVFAHNCSAIVRRILETQSIVGTVRNGEAKCRGSSDREKVFGKVIGAFDDLLLIPCTHKQCVAGEVNVAQAEKEIKEHAFEFVHPLAYSGVWEVAEDKDSRVWVMQPSGMLAVASIEDMLPLFYMKHEKKITI